MLDRMRVANMERWGRLVKTWATGEDRLGDGKSYPVPRTLEEFKQQCALAQVGLYLPARINALAVVTYEKNTVVLRLPPADLIRESEAHLADGNEYLIDGFYAAAFERDKEIWPKLGGPDQKRAFNDARIGDYTISNCQ
jgi:hypothetical protein